MGGVKMINIDRAVELEEKKLSEQLEDGMVDTQEYNRSLSQLYREATDAVREEADRAWQQIMDRYGG